MEARWYQKECVDALFDFVANKDENAGKHPIGVVPTAGGKTFILCLFIDKWVTAFPNSNILILSHVEEILEQDAEAIKEYFGIEPGIYSSGLGKKEIKKITVAGIQSIHRKPELFSDFDIIIIDECHLVPTKGEGMYRSFLTELDATYVGLTATHFRLGHGYIHQGEGALFTDIAYDLSEMEKFNRLVDEGYLAKLYSKKPDLVFDTKNIPLKGGDYKEQALSDAFDRDEITRKAVAEIIHYGKNYKKWLIFTIDIQHAENVNAMLLDAGIKSVCVHSKMNMNRKTVISDYKNGTYQAIVNVDVLTTGFNVPSVDLIAILRPTKSPVIHVQTIGRGLRIAEGKDHCLVLDFAGNIAELGPINAVRIKQKQKGESGAPIIKECPDCQLMHHPSVKECPCGYEFKFKVGLTSSAQSSEVVLKETVKKIRWLEVKDTTFSVYQKAGKPPSLKVTYYCGIHSYNEWVHLDHEGYALHKARHWVRRRWTGDKESLPMTTSQLYNQRGRLKKTFAIYVDTSEKYPTIVDARFE